MKTLTQSAENLQTVKSLVPLTPGFEPGSIEDELDTLALRFERVSRIRCKLHGDNDERAKAWLGAAEDVRGVIARRLAAGDRVVVMVEDKA